MTLARRTFAFTLALLPLAAVSRQAVAENLPTTIRFGDVGFGLANPFGQGLLSIADAKGFIAKEFEGTPVKLQFNYFTGTGPAINEALSNGQLDVVSYGSVPNVIGKANGLPTRLLLAYGGTNMFGGARTDLDIKSITDLKGKRVTLQKATILHWGLIRALQEAGLSEKDVTIVDLKTADQLAAIASKSVDVVFGPSFILPLKEKGLIQLFYRSKDLGPRGSGFGGILSTNAFATQYPEATQRIVRGILRAAKFIAKEENRDEVFQIWSRNGTSAESYKQEFDGIALKEAYNPLIDDFALARYRSVIAFNREQKLIRNDVDLAKWIDTSFLDRGLKDTGLEKFWPKRQETGAEIN